MIEEFRPIPEFEGLYSISNTGKIVKHAYTVQAKGKFNRTWKVPEHEIKGSIAYTGYKTVELTDKEGNEKYFYVHRLVAMTFIPNPENKPTVNHIDGNRSNNCIDNLEWATQTEQIQHSIRSGLGAGGGYKVKRRIQRLDNGFVYESLGSCSRDFGLNGNTIYSHIRRNAPINGVYLKDLGLTVCDSPEPKKSKRLKYKNCTTGEVFPNRSSAARSIGVSDSAIYNAIKEDRPCKGMIFKVLKEE